MQKIIDEMHTVAKGQQNVDVATIQVLRELTGKLLAIRRDEALAEYERFLSVAKREIALPRERLSERFGGKTILVTGGTGCIGSVLVEQLSAFDPARIVSISRGVTCRRPQRDGVEYVHVDVRDRARVSEVISGTKPNLILHVASQRDPGLAETQVHRTVTTNILGTRNVLEAAMAAGVEQVVCASTGKALRPFSPDTYTASKRVAEWLAADAAASGLRCSAARFTHVVDNSIIHQRLREWAGSSSVIRLHSADIFFYVQSAVEAAQLLMLGSLDTEPGEFRIHTITDLGWPVNLLDVALGMLFRMNSTTPIYFSGYDPGYEEIPFPALYDPETAGDVSPLVNAFEATSVVESNCAMTGAFRVQMAPSERVPLLLAALASMCSETEDPDKIRVYLRDLSWGLLDATLDGVATKTLIRIGELAETWTATLSAEHRQILEAIQSSIERRRRYGVATSSQNSQVSAC